MDEELGDRVLYLPRGGQDPLEDRCLLADVIAASKADLFDNGGGGVVGIDRGMPVGVTPAILLDVIMKHIAIKLPVNLGTENAPSWRVTYPPYVPDEGIVRALFMARTREEGGLACRLPKWPSEPRKLTPRQQVEVQTRLRTGEPMQRIAAAYGVEIDEVRRQAAR